MLGRIGQRACEGRIPSLCSSSRAVPVPTVRRSAANNDRGRRRGVQALFMLLAILAAAVLYSWPSVASCAGRWKG